MSNEESVRRRARRLWAEWARPMLVMIVIVGSFRSAIADWNDVPTGSMKPTILEGDRILVNRMAYDLRLPFTHRSVWKRGDPARGDVVVCSSPDGIRLVKRVIGLPGDRLEIVGNRLAIQGIPIDYGPAFRDGTGAVLRQEELPGAPHLVRLEPSPSPFATFGPLSIPPGRYLVMGDNRDDSLDSRAFGLIPRADILGRATHVALSVDPRRQYRPRLRRFGISLDPHP